MGHTPLNLTQVMAVLMSLRIDHRLKPRVTVIIKDRPLKPKRLKGLSLLFFDT